MQPLQTSSTRYDSRLTVNLSASPLFTGLLALLHLGAGALVFSLTLPWELRLIVLGAVGASAWHAVRRYGLRVGRWAVTAMEFGEDRESPVRVTTSVGEIECRIRGIYCQPWLVLLRLRCPDCRLALPVIVTADSLAAESFRQLRVRLRQWAPAV